MRLQKLELSGFGPFRDKVEFDFTDSDFFALVGPTGSGKSTVIDAMCFALYGSVPRYDNKNLIKFAMTLGALEAKVSLTFELAGRTYIATRVMRRDKHGAVKTKEARLEAVGGDAIASGEREVTDAVVRLLGLQFDDFTRCVALPQGDFAEFLRAKGDSRRDLMMRLLNLTVYERVGQRARQLAAESDAQVKLSVQALEQLAFATPDRLAAAQAHVTEVQALQAHLTTTRPQLDAITQDLTARRAEIDATVSAISALEKLAVPTAVRELGDELSLAHDQVARVEKEAGAAEAARVELETLVAGLPDLADLRIVAEAHGERASCASTIETTTAARVSIAERLEAGAAAVAAAEQIVVDAETALDNARHANLAHAVAATLTAGEPCPVCLQPVAKLPPRQRVAKVDAAEAAMNKAKAARDKAKRAAEKDDKEIARIDAELRGLESRLEALAAKVAPHADTDALAALIGDAEAAHSRLASARATEHEARKQLDADRKAVERLHAAAQQAQTLFDGQRDSVANLKPPAPERAQLLDDWNALVGWAAGEVENQRAIAHDAEAAFVAAQSRRAEVVADLRVRFDALDLGSPSDDAAELSALVATADAEARHRVAEITKAMADAARIEEESGEARERAEIASLLGQLMRADRFSEWLVAEALELLVVEASAMLRELTGGQYSLATTNKEFEVVDHGNADERRPARSLSGGETFQASLSLALALAKQVRNLAAAGAPTLDAILLDEGFGTLDAETLDVVASTIENLGASGRMVGVITHVRELAARVPVRFEISKGPRTSAVDRVVA